MFQENFIDEGVNTSSWEMLYWMFILELLVVPVDIKISVIVGKAYIIAIKLRIKIDDTIKP